MANQQSVLNKILADAELLPSPPLATLETAKSWAMMMEAFNRLASAQLVLANSRLFCSIDDSITDDYHINLTGYTTYEDLDMIVFRAKTSNLGASTLQINALLSHNLVKNGDLPLEANDIKANQIIFCVYDKPNTVFQLVGGGNSTINAQTINGYALEDIPIDGGEI